MTSEEDAAEDAGDKELAGRLAQGAYEKMGEMMELVSEAKARASARAITLLSLTGCGEASRKRTQGLEGLGRR